MSFLRRKRPCNACGHRARLYRAGGYRVCARCRPAFTRRGPR